MNRNVVAILVVVLLVLLLGVGALVLLDDSGTGGTEVQPYGSETPAETEVEETDEPEEQPEEEVTRWERRGHGKVSGRLVEYGSERPIAGVEVTLEAGYPGPGEQLAAVTGADGSFLFERVTNFGDWILGADAPEPLRDLELAGVDVVEDRETQLGIIYLTPDFRVPGIVVDEAGDPVPGAIVRVSRGREAGAGIDVLRLIRELPAPSSTVDSAITDAEGRFELGKLPPGSYDFEVRAETYEQLHERGVLINPESQDRELRFRLPRGFSLEGQVIRKSGGPVQGIPIAAFPRPDSPTELLRLDKRMSVTDEDGRFVVDGLGGGEYWVAASPEGEPIALAMGIQLPGQRSVEIVLQGDASLVGRVTNASEEPIPGAQVFVGNVQRNPPMVGHAVADADGRYRIDGLKAGPLQMFMVTAEGYGTYPDDFLKIMMGRTQGLQLQAGENVRDVVMGDGGTVRGVVLLSGSDQPVEGAKVSAATPAAFFGGNKTTVTNAQGEFELTGLPVGSLMLLVSKDGHFQPGVTPMTMAMNLGRRMQGGDVGSDPGRGPTVVITEPGAVVERELKLAVGSMVTGQVFDPAGEPLAGAQVRVELASEGGGFMSQLGSFFPLADPRLTDADGRFTISAPGPGQAGVIVADAQGYLETKSESFTAKPGETVEGIEVTMRQGGTIAGVVTTEAGAPLEGATVRYIQAGEDLREWSARWQLGNAEPSTTGPDGTFLLTNVESGPLLLQVDHGSHQSVSRKGVEVGEGERLDLEFALPGGLALSGVVVDATGAPVPGAEVNFNFTGDPPPNRDPYWRAPSDVRTDAEGRFRVDGVLPGSWVLWAEAEGHADSPQLDTTAGSSGIKLTLAQAFEIAGWVRTENGRPVAGVDVDAYRVFTKDDGSTGESYEEDATTDEDGAFVIRELPTGTYSLRIGSSRWFSGGGDTDVVPTRKDGIEAGTGGVLIQVDSGLSLEVRVRHADGTPVLAGYAQATRQVGEADEDKTNLQRGGPVLDGKVRLTGLLPGKYQISVQDDAEGKGAAIAEAGGAPVEVTITSTGTIEGVAVGPDGSLLSRGWVTATSADGGGTESAQVQPDGTFKIAGVLPGTVTVRVTVNLDGQWKRGGDQTVELTTGGSVTGVRIELPAE